MKSKPEKDCKLIYRLFPDFSETSGLYCVRKDTKGFNEYKFYDGVLIDNWPKDITFFCQGEQLLDYIIGGLHWQLISERTRRVLLKNKIFGAQLLPVDIIHETTEQWLSPYWVLNVFQEIQTLTWKHAENKDIFRLRIKNRGDSTIFISYHLKSLLEEANSISGMSFTKVPFKP